MKKILLAFASIVFFNVLNAQTQFKDSVFSKIEVTTSTYAVYENDSLQLDYYRAKKAKGKLPLVVYVHGGGFQSGQRGGRGLINFANKLAGRGYAVASISYRLTMKDKGFGCDTDALLKKHAFDDASTDIDLAVAYMFEHNEDFLVDESKIVLSGSSAGAEAVLNTVYDFEHTLLPSDFKYGGVISMAGALTTLENISEESAIPTQMFHGTGDNLVPYDVAPHHYCTKNQPGYWMLYGSGAIARKLKGLGKTYYLYSLYGGSHRWAGDPMELFFDDIVDFLYNDVANPFSNRQTERMMNDPHN
jgi:dienelactone hydrolase